MQIQKSFSSKVLDWVIIVVLALLALSCLAPIIHTLALSLSSRNMAEAGRVTFWPMEFTTNSYQEILKDSQFTKSFLISVERVLLGCAVNFVLMIITAFPLAHSSKVFPGRNAFMWFLIFTMLFNGGLIPTYMLISKLGIMDTIWSLVLPGAVPVWNIILLMNFFKALPHELEEACVIDGAGPWKVLMKFYLPLSLPALATVMLFTMVNHWNSFFDGLIYMNDPSHFPLQTYIYKLQVVFDATNTANMTAEELIRLSSISYKTFNAAKIFIAMIPMLAIYPFLQRYFVKGIVMGAVKG